MRYLNQLDYEDMPYPTDIEHPESEFAVHGNVRMAGCGLCSACMVVDKLCAVPFSLVECRDLSVSIGANHAIGTDMRILAPAVAKRFNLQLLITDDISELTDCLHAGGAAIINVGGDHDSYIGTFSSIGHYIVAIQEVNNEFCLLDPSWTKDKYRTEPRCSRVRQHGNLLYATAEVVQKDVETRIPAYFLFFKRW